MSVRIVGISMSPRHANTDLMVKAALEGAQSVGSDIVTEFVSLANKDIKGCTNCRACVKKGYCVIKDDWEECFRPLRDPVPDGVVFGAPVYFFNLNSQARAFLERTTSLLKGQFFPEAKQFPPDWSRTAAAGLAVGYDRNGGQEHAISSLGHWFLINNFVLLGGTHVGYIGAPGWDMGDSQRDSVLGDTKVGMAAARIIGEKVARTGWMLQLGAAEMERRAEVQGDAADRA
jgi:multimeric flavodoxin WrbA